MHRKIHTCLLNYEILPQSLTKIFSQYDKAQYEVTQYPKKRSVIFKIFIKEFIFEIYRRNHKNIFLDASHNFWKRFRVSTMRKSFLSTRKIGFSENMRHQQYILIA